MTSHSGKTPIQFPMTYCPVTLRRVFPSNWVGAQPPPILPYPIGLSGFVAPAHTDGGSKCTSQTPCKMSPTLGAFGSPVEGVAPTEGIARIRGPPLGTFPVHDNAAFPSDESQGWAFPGPTTAW